MQNLFQPRLLSARKNKIEMDFMLLSEKIKAADNKFSIKVEKKCNWYIFPFSLRKHVVLAIAIDNQSTINLISDWFFMASYLEQNRWINIKQFYFRNIESDNTYFSDNIYCFQSESKRVVIVTFLCCNFKIKKI